MQPRIVFMGSPEFALPTLRALVGRYPVVGVVTQPDRTAVQSLPDIASPKQLLRGEVLDFEPCRHIGSLDGIFVCLGRLEWKSGIGQGIPEGLPDRDPRRDTALKLQTSR